MENSDIVKVFVQSPREELRPFIKRFLVAEFLLEFEPTVEHYELYVALER